MWRTGWGLSCGAGRDTTVWSRKAGGGAAAWWHPPAVPKNETVILVIYGYFWLFFIPIFIVTYCFTIVCDNFLACKTGGIGSGSLRHKNSAKTGGALGTVEQASGQSLFLFFIVTYGLFPPACSVVYG
jgi:hypothetical protein